MVHGGWRWAALAAGGLLIVSNAVWAFTVVDQAVTITYMQEGYADTERALDTARQLMPQLGAVSTRKDLVTTLRRIRPDGLIVDNNEGVSIDGLTFEFVGDRIEAVHR